MCLFALLLGCASPPSSEAEEGPALGETVQVVPGEGLPEEVETQAANNNLDVIRYDGRTFLAFRTAPSHFASDQTRLYVVSSEDEQTWTFEASYSLETDLREPRFLAVDDQLFLYFAVLGTNPLDFEPQGTLLSVYLGPGDWSAPEDVLEEGFIPWRARVLDGVAYLIGYIGGAEIYDASEEPVEVYWLRTEDGRTFEPVVPGQPVVLSGGGSETDFVLMDDGDLIAVSRNEAGDETGFGSKICRAEASDLGTWSCEADPKKYDSPLLFRRGQDIWLVGRRNVTESGDYDLGTEGELAEQSAAYALDYWQQPKRCSLWSVDPDALSVRFELDLPSRGDTCFPSILDADADTSTIYNYSSDIEGADLSWLEGQTGDTFIYRTEIHW